MSEASSWGMETGGLGEVGAVAAAVATPAWAVDGGGGGGGGR